MVVVWHCLTENVSAVVTYGNLAYLIPYAVLRVPAYSEKGQKNRLKNMVSDPPCLIGKSAKVLYRQVV
jgi:hypothetical protein